MDFKHKQMLIERNKSGKNWRGKHLSETHKQKVSDSLKGHSVNHVNDEYRRKLRVAAIKQHKKNGISFPAVDNGAIQEFTNLNLHNGFHIQFPNIELEEIGYFLDGYDPVLHAVFEYDGKKHAKISEKKKDAYRQQQIIKYFETKNLPLKHFFRINRTGFGEQGMYDALITNKE